jgi:predicted membrane metal-binding protein
MMNDSVTQDHASHMSDSSTSREFLFVNTQIQAMIARILPELEATLLIQILLGMETRSPKAMQDAFSTTSTTHVIAISGSNYERTMQVES